MDTGKLSKPTSHTRIQILISFFVITFCGRLYFPRLKTAIFLVSHVPSELSHTLPLNQDGLFVGAWTDGGGGRGGAEAMSHDLQGEIIQDEMGWCCF